MILLITSLLTQLYGINVALAASVKCPNPATNCLTDSLNLNVIPRLGCLGCQTGCKPGYLQTANPKYYQITNDPFGSYKYETVEVQNSVNVYEPEWICNKGTRCPPGYFLGGSGQNVYCASCSKGCSECPDYETCDTCFLGYSRHTVKSETGKITSTCVSSNVKCPTQPSNCTYEVYVSKGSGCLGCQYCSPGYTVTFNPSYLKATNNSLQSGSYMYSGIEIRNNIDINQPRYVCAEGKKCTAGFYGRQVNNVLVCEWCGHGCASCTHSGACTACDSSSILSKDGTCKSTLIG